MELVLSRVIRGSGPPARSVVPAEVYDAREEAERILREAHDAAETLRANAIRDAARDKSEARAQGRAEGRAEAANLLLEAARARDRVLTEAERDTKTLALAIAKRVIGEDIQLAPARIEQIVGELLGRARRAREVVVRVHPDDAEALAGATLPPSVRVAVDESLTRGGCVVHSELGELDARVEVQLAAIAHALGCTPP